MAWLDHDGVYVDGGEFTYRQVATGIEQLVGYKTSPSYLQVLRTGIRINPSIKHLHGLCAFFGAPIEYFFDEDLARQLDAQLDVAASLRDPSLRELATRAVGLSAEALETLTRMVEHVRHLEGLDTRPAGASASNGAPTSFHPRRRGRRAHPRGGETPASDGPSANGASSAPGGAAGSLACPVASVAQRCAFPSGSVSVRGQGSVVGGLRRLGIELSSGCQRCQSRQQAFQCRSHPIPVQPWLTEKAFPYGSRPGHPPARAFQVSSEIAVSATTRDAGVAP